MQPPYGNQYGQPGYQQPPQYPPSIPPGGPIQYPPSSYDNKGTMAGEYVMGSSQRPGVQATALQTLRPNLSSNTHSDMLELKKAFEGVGCNASIVVEIFCRRTSLQRDAIQADYLKEFGKSLKDRIKKELFDPLDQIIIFLMQTGPVLDAYCIRKATKGPTIDYKTIAHIIVTRSHRQLQQVVERFAHKYKKSMAEVINQQLTGKFRDAVLHLINHPRQERDANAGLAAQQAATIFNRNQMASTQVDQVIPILCQSSYHQIIMVAQQFETNYRQHIERYFEGFGGDYEYLLLNICTYALQPNRFFAKELYTAIREKDHKKIIMIIVSRCEVDLGDILRDYSTLYGSRPEIDIQNAFAGKETVAIDALMILIGFK